MKNRTKIIIVCVILISAIIVPFAIFSYASELDKTKSISVLPKEKVSNSTNILTKIENNDEFNKDLLLQKATEYKSIINSKDSSKAISNHKIKENKNTIQFYNNEIDSRNESSIDFEDELICLNADTGELIHYTQKNPSLSATNLSENEIKEIGLQLYESIKEMLNNEYVYTELEQYDEEIWTIRFYKYYDGLINPGESVKISFSPESHEIVNLVILNNEFANNAVEISQEEAFSIAKKYMKKTTATEMHSEMKIINPNYFWFKNAGSYKNVNILRKAYVFICNDKASVEIYVDCTTGEVIGGNMITGGEI